MSHSSEYRDSAWLAAAVRGLAGDVHRLASRADRDPREVEELTGRIRQVRDLLPEHSTPLHRWLEGLELEVASETAGTPSFV